MTPILLVDALVKRIKQIVHDFDLETKKDDLTKTPEVYAGYLPPKLKSREEDDFPYILVRFLTESDNENDVASIRLIIGTFSEDEQDGWRDPLNIATRIKIALKKSPALDSFSLRDRIKIELFEEQPYPYWFAMMDMDFDMPQVQLDWSENGLDY
ncbi:hypothetical protein F9U64_18995 [Gracilibacillus oryzae]|uniref:Uncharacterized protein n=1 Tax=Gracilibacillus oryzae TaxID=1672701 RepID=A0A7C8L1E7_9BACI|nr:hypothetical protein [Gracilibacillus oryzae]KAB8126909.1 hypothetical protein F9U64_18995 [Gracilibacillus oryzae]